MSTCRLSWLAALGLAALISTPPRAHAGDPAVDGVWSFLAPEVAAPSARREYAAIFDAQNDRYLLFGGWGFESPSPGGLFHEVWSLTMGDPPLWAQVVPAGQSPGERHSPQWGYDPARQRLIIFGGYGHHLPDGENAYLNDVWELSLDGTPTWSEITPAGDAPTPRLAGAAIYDPLRQRLIGFGGTVGLPVDTWQLDLSEEPHWSTVQTSGATIPNAGYGMTAIYDPVRDRMLMFGGSTSDYYYGVHNDVWQLTLSDDPPVWTKLSPHGTGPLPTADDTLPPPAPTDSSSLPVARRTLTSFYDPLRDRMIIFAGWDSRSNDVSSFLNDAWALSLSGDPVWTRLAPDGPAPMGRDAMAAAYDSKADRMVVFGGWSGDTMLNDTWFLEWGESGLTPTMSASAQADPDVARVRWTVQGVTGPQAGVFRRETGKPWSYVATTTRDASGAMLYDDHSVVAGKRYAYQLVVPSQIGQVPGGEVWVDVPTAIGVPPDQALEFALQPVRPNPLAGPFVVAFSLPGGGPARIDVLDLSGRRLLSRDVGGLGPGPHQIELGRGTDFAPGLYFVRLERGGKQLTSRVVVGGQRGAAR